MPLNMRFRFSPTKDGLVKVLAGHTSVEEVHRAIG